MLRHGAYLLVMGSLFVYHVVYPWAIQERMEMRAVEELVWLHNRAVDLGEERDILEKMRALIIYHEHAPRERLLACAKDVRGHKAEIASLYEKVANGPMGIPVFLRYSQECNFALFSPIFVPLAIVALANALRMRKKVS